MACLPNTNINSTRNMPSISTIWGARDGMGRNLIALILLMNAFLSVITSSVQLYSGYQRDETRILLTIETIDESFRDGFEDALWDYNFGLIEALLNGVFNKNYVEYVKLTTVEGRTWELGNRNASGAVPQDIEFFHEAPNGDELPLGNLSVVLSFDVAWERMWSQAWTILASNFAKTVVACIFMLLLFDRRISRHLKTIATYVARTSWPKNDQLIQLDRPNQRVADELDHIVTAINTAKHKSHSDFALLEREIEQRQIVEAMLKHRTGALEEANREQAEFTYAISHDLKAPANTICMLLGELAELETERLSADGREILDDAKRTVLRMTHLVEDVLGYARTVESPMEPEDIDLDAMARDIEHDLRGDITAARATVTIDDLPSVEGNAIQMRLLLQNLMSNAIKFRDPNRHPKINITKLPGNADSQVGFSVCDNGIGIDADYHEKVFGMFQRLHAYGEYDGTGLGLSLCKRIVNNHGGKITLRSNPGQGSCFEIWLPRRQK